jgi:hypothetical protein
MTEKKISPSHLDNTLDAASSVVGTLTRIAGGVAGLVTIGVIAGWVEATSYFSELGAPWVTWKLSVSYLLESSAPIEGLIALIALRSFFKTTFRTRQATRSRSWVTSFLGLGALLTGVSAWAPHYAYLTAATAALVGVLGAISMACAVGLALGELIARLGESNLKWDSVHVALLAVTSVFGLLAPAFLGAALADRESDEKSTHFPIVLTNPADPGRVWRLVTPLDSEYLVISLANTREDRMFRVLKASEMLEIHSSRQSTL